MNRFAEVTHQVWIAAPLPAVQSQFADLEHHICANVHPKLRLEVLSQAPGRARYVQHVRLLGLKQRDVFEREVYPDGRIVDVSVEGFNKGGRLQFDFAARTQQERPGTEVTIVIRLPLPPLIGRWVRPLLEAQVRKEVTQAADEDKYDLEQRGYAPSRPALPLPQAA